MQQEKLHKICDEFGERYSVIFNAIKSKLSLNVAEVWGPSNDYIESMVSPDNEVSGRCGICQTQLTRCYTAWNL